MIEFFIEVKNFTFPSTISYIKVWLESIIVAEKQKLGDINFIFIDDDEILKINSQYLSHHYTTDIITFDRSYLKIVSGDIYISVETVESNSNQYQTSFQTELFRVMSHGILHLLGYLDSTASQKKLMRQKEDHYLVSCQG